MSRLRRQFESLLRIPPRLYDQFGRAIDLPYRGRTQVGDTINLKRPTL